MCAPRTPTVRLGPDLERLTETPGKYPHAGKNLKFPKFSVLGGHHSRAVQGTRDWIIGRALVTVKPALRCSTGGSWFRRAVRPRMLERAVGLHFDSLVIGRPEARVTVKI